MDAIVARQDNHHKTLQTERLHKVSHGQRFVVRAAQNRRLEEAPSKLFELPEVLATAGSPPSPDVNQLQRSQHKKYRQQRPGASVHVCLLPGAGPASIC